MNWQCDEHLKPNEAYVYDKSKLVCKIFDDCIVYEYDGKPFLRIKK